MIFKWLSIFIGVAYIALGIFVIVKKYFVIQLDDKVAYIFGALLVVYGFFRIIRGGSRINKNRNE